MTKTPKTIADKTISKATYLSISCREMQNNLMRLYKSEFWEAINKRRKPMMKLIKRCANQAKRNGENELNQWFEGQYFTWRHLDDEIKTAIKEF